MCDYKSSVCQGALYDSDAAAKMRLPLLISEGKFAPSDLECWEELTLKWFCWQFHTIYCTFPHKQAVWILMTCQANLSNTLWIRSEVTWMHKQEELAWTRRIRWPHIATCMYVCVCKLTKLQQAEIKHIGNSKHKCTQEKFNIKFLLNKWKKSKSTVYWIFSFSLQYVV